MRILTNQEISLLCDVAESRKIKDKYKPMLDGLMADGFVEAIGIPPQFKVTRKGHRFLAERGVGLNEA